MIFKEQWLWWNVLSHIAEWVYNGWIGSGLVWALSRLFGGKLSRVRTVASRLKGELQLLYWPTAAVLMIDTMQDPEINPWVKPILIALYVWLWYLYKNLGDDNDKWKKRLKKLKEKVSVRAGRLVVTSA